MRRGLSLAASVSAVVLVLLAGAPQASATGGKLRGTIEHFTTEVTMENSPLADPATAPTVSAFATVRGCQPGRFIYAWVELEQDGITLDTPTGRGGPEYLCGDDGTLRIGSQNQGVLNQSVPHPGRARARLWVNFCNCTPNTLLAERWVSIPG